MLQDIIDFKYKQKEPLDGAGKVFILNQNKTIKYDLKNFLTLQSIQVACELIEKVAKKIVLTVLLG